jgi:hypothetical protein
MSDRTNGSRRLRRVGDVVTSRWRLSLSSTPVWTCPVQNWFTTGWKIHHDIKSQHVVDTRSDTAGRRNAPGSSPVNVVNSKAHHPKHAAIDTLRTYPQRTEIGRRATEKRRSTRCAARGLTLPASQSLARWESRPGGRDSARRYSVWSPCQLDSLYSTFRSTAIVDRLASTTRNGTVGRDRLVVQHGRRREVVVDGGVGHLLDE